MAYTPLTTDLVSTSLRHYVAVFHMNSRQSPENRAGLSHKLSTTGVCLICSQRLKDPLFFHSCDLILILEFRYLQIPILMCKFTVHRAVIPTHHFLLKKENIYNINSIQRSGALVEHAESKIKKQTKSTLWKSCFLEFV